MMAWTLRDQFEAFIAETEADSGWLIGPDWWQITPEEAHIFQIDMHRFDRIVTAHHAYEAVKDAVHSCIGEEPLLEQARTKHPEWCKPEHTLDDFGAFAVAFGGITWREAYAIYYRQQFWEVRLGVWRYPDEPE